MYSNLAQAYDDLHFHIVQAGNLMDSIHQSQTTLRLRSDCRRFDAESILRRRLRFLVVPSKNHCPILNAATP